MIVFGRWWVEELEGSTGGLMSSLKKWSIRVCEARNKVFSRLLNVTKISMEDGEKGSDCGISEQHILSYQKFIENA